MHVVEQLGRMTAAVEVGTGTWALVELKAGWPELAPSPVPGSMLETPLVSPTSGLQTLPSCSPGIAVKNGPVG